MEFINNDNNNTTNNNSNKLSVTERRLRRAVRCAACIDQPGSFNPDLAADMPLPELDEKGQKAHAQFMTYVFDLIDGTRDSSQYEDDVRALLGRQPPGASKFAADVKPRGHFPHAISYLLMVFCVVTLPWCPRRHKQLCALHAGQAHL